MSAFSFLLYLCFPWRETKTFTRSQRTKRKKCFKYTIDKEDMPGVVANKHVSIRFLPQSPRPFPLLTDNLRAESARNGQ